MCRHPTLWNVIAIFSTPKFYLRATATGRHLHYVITQCYLSYLPPDTSELTPHNPSQTGWYSIYLPQRDGRLSWPTWFCTYGDGLPVSRQSPIQVLVTVSPVRYAATRSTGTLRMGLTGGWESRGNQPANPGLPWKMAVKRYACVVAYFFMMHRWQIGLHHDMRSLACLYPGW